MTFGKILVRSFWRTTGTHLIVRNNLSNVVGVSHIPETGPFILVANHNSLGDALALEPILFAVRGDRPFFLAKSEGFTGRRRMFYESIGGVPVDRRRPGADTSAAVDRILGAGHVLVIFPEGRRGPGGRMLPFFDGPFSFAVAADVPVVPAAITGTRQILPKGSLIPNKGRARVAFGTPLLPDAALPRRNRITRLRRDAREAICQLLAELDACRWDAAGQARDLTWRAEAVLDRPAEHTGRWSRRLAKRRAAILLQLARHNDPGDLAAPADQTAPSTPRRDADVVRARSASEDGQPASAQPR